MDYPVDANSIAEKDDDLFNLLLLNTLLVEVHNSIQQAAPDILPTSMIPFLAGKVVSRH